MKTYLEFIKENNTGEAEKVSAQINSIFDKFGWQIEFVPGDGDEVERDEFDFPIGSSDQDWFYRQDGSWFVSNTFRQDVGDSEFPSDDDISFMMVFTYDDKKQISIHLGAHEVTELTSYIQGRTPEWAFESLLDIDDADITKYFGVRLPKDLNDLERFLTEIDSVFESGKYKEILKGWEEDYL